MKNRSKVSKRRLPGSAAVALRTPNLGSVMQKSSLEMPRSPSQHFLQVSPVTSTEWLLSFLLCKNQLAHIKKKKKDQHCNREVFGGKAMPGIGCGLQQNPLDTSSERVLCSGLLGTDLCSRLRGSTEQPGDVRAAANLTPLRRRATEMDFKMEQAPENKRNLKNLQ